MVNMYDIALFTGACLLTHVWKCPRNVGVRELFGMDGT